MQLFKVILKDKSSPKFWHMVMGIKELHTQLSRGFIDVDVFWGQFNAERQVLILKDGNQRIIPIQQIAAIEYLEDDYEHEDKNYA